MPLKINRQLYVGGVLSVLLFGCESWCVTMEMLTSLRNWHNARIREMCRVTMRHVELHRITSVELQQRIGIWDLDYYLARRTLLWLATSHACQRADCRGDFSLPGSELLDRHLDKR